MFYQVDPILRKILYLFDRTLQKEDKDSSEPSFCKGFNRYDYDLLCSISRYFLKNGRVTDKQHEVCVNRLYKYRHHKIPDTWSVERFIDLNKPKSTSTLPKGVCLIVDEPEKKTTSLIDYDAIQVREVGRQSDCNEHKNWQTLF